MSFLRRLYDPGISGKIALTAGEATMAHLKLFVLGQPQLARDGTPRARSRAASVASSWIQPALGMRHYGVTSSRPLPTRPGHMALWILGKVLVLCGVVIGVLRFVKPCKETFRQAMPKRGEQGEQSRRLPKGSPNSKLRK